MLQKWKFILSNWINCYFNDIETKECITDNTLLTIISHLHKNLNLDESKSSTLEAQNIEGFILEKYSEFKFENGTVEPTNEEELYVVASLLLFFVCINSKDMDIKQAMCSQLSPEDQETIMKFSKCLMECSPVTYRDVLAAITEACGQEAGPAKAPCAGPSVAETPPALRSLHGEVRRLQAALDAERFDRNYLQEELSRTNLRMEKLLKDKEQHKLEIVNLKAKISLCCGDVSESRGSEAAGEDTARLTRQLHELEDKLGDTQSQLDDTQYERDMYKAKIEELKLERDRWLAYSQEESIRSGQLAEELETERRRAASLQEVVADLRLHLQNNRLDASQLECDDPNASIHSLQNTSVCSEACANVIEVQLEEERAKVTALKQQIQSMQEQLTALKEQAESEKLALENIIIEKENGICDLKHHINQEIQEKNNLKAHFNDEISKLNNDINELEQKLKESSEISRSTIDQKMQEIQILQEEKLSLLQNLTDETTKLDNIIKDLQTDIDTEKNLKVRMKEDYENQLMTLNEKVLNRNNELVELQNKVFEKGETMELLNLELKKEKELNHELSNKHNDEIIRLNQEKNNIENMLQKKTEEAKELQKRLFQNVAVFDEMNQEIDDLKAANEGFRCEIRELEQIKNYLQSEIQQRDSNVEGIRKEIENITDIFSNEKDKFAHNLEEKTATINALQVRLRDEIQYKVILEKELQQLHQTKTEQNDKIHELSEKVSTLKASICEKDRMVYALELYLKEERHTNLTLKASLEKLSAEYSKLNEELSAKNTIIIGLEEQLLNKDKNLDSTTNKLLSEMEEKEALELLLMSVNEEKEIINKDLVDRCNELEKMQEDYDKLRADSEENLRVIEALGSKIDAETKKYLQLELDFDTQTSNLISKLSESEKAVSEIASKSKHTIEEKERQIKMLEIEIENLNQTVAKDREDMDKLIRERQALVQKLEEEKSFRTNIEKEYQSQCAMLDCISSQLNNEISQKSAEINSLKHELESLMYKTNEKSEELKLMETKLIQENEASKELEYLKNQEIKQLKSKIDELHILNDEYEQDLKKEIASKTQAIDALQRENEQLHFTIEEDNSSHEVILKEKDIMIESLEEHVKVLTLSIESLRKDYEDGTFTYEKIKVELQDKLEAQDNEIIMLTEKIEHVKRCLEQAMLDAEAVRQELKDKNEIIKENIESKNKLLKQVEEYVAELTQSKDEKKELESNIATLKSELDNEITTKILLDKEKSELLKQYTDLVKELKQKESASDNLLKDKISLSEEMTMLTQQLNEEQTCRSIAEQNYQSLLEAKKVIDQQLSEKLEAEKILLHEKEFLLSDKKSLIQQLENEIKIKEEHIAEKIAMKQQLIEIEQTEKALLKEKEILSQELSTVFEDKRNILSEKQAIEYQLIEKESTTKALLEEKKQLLKEKQCMSISLESGDQTKQTLLAEMQAAEQKLLAKEDTINELLHEKGKILIEKENILEQLESAQKENQSLVADKQALENKLSEKEVLCLTFCEEKEHLDAERSILSQKLQSLNEEMKTFELQMFGRDAKEKILLEKIDRLTKELASADSIKDIAESERKALEVEKKIIEEQLKRELQEKGTILQQLKETQLDMEALITEKQALENQLKESMNVKTEFEEVKEYLMKQLELTEKEKLNILEEKETADHKSKLQIEDLSHKLYKEKAERQYLECQISAEVETKNSVLEVKEYLALQLIEEKAAKKLLEEQKETLQKQKNLLDKKLIAETQKKSELEEERHYLLHEKNELNEARNQEVDKLNELIEEKLQEISKLSETLEEEKCNKNLIYEEKEKLLNENSSLNNTIVELKAIQDILTQDKEVLSVEKEALIQSLNEEKAFRDKIESEKNAVSITLQELNEKYALDMTEKQDQLTHVSSELKQVKMDFKKHEDISVNLASVVNSGLEKILQNINKERYKKSDFLQKSISIERDEVSLSDKCTLIINIANTLSNELSMVKNLEKALEHESSAVNEMKEMIKEKEITIFELQTEINRLQKALQDSQNELIKATEIYNTTLDAKVKDIQKLQLDNKSLNNELNDVKVQLNVKVHSLNEKLVDNENLTEKLKKTYECQIENLNVMVTKLTGYLKEKTCELDVVRREKDKLQQTIDENDKVIKTLEEEIKTQKTKQEKLISDFESERLVIKNMVTVTESIMEDQKVSMSNIIADHEKTIENYQREKKILDEQLEITQRKGEDIIKEKQCAFDTIFKELTGLRKEKDDIEKKLSSDKEALNKEITHLKEEIINLTSSRELMAAQNKIMAKEKEHVQIAMDTEKEKFQKEIDALKEEIGKNIVDIESLQIQNMNLSTEINRLKDDLLCLREKDSELQIEKNTLESDLIHRIDKMTKVLNDDTSKNDKYKYNLHEKLQAKNTVQEKVKILTDEVIDLVKEKNEYISRLDEVKAEAEANEIKAKEEIEQCKVENKRLETVISENKIVISNLEQLLKRELDQAMKLREDNANDRLTYENRCALLQEYQTKAEKLLQDREKEIAHLKGRLKCEVDVDRVIENLREELVKKDTTITIVAQGKDEVINTLNKELMDEKAARERYQQELEKQGALVSELRQQLGELSAANQNYEDKIKAMVQRDTFAVASQEKTSSNKLIEKDHHDRHQVSTPTSDLTHSSIESIKTISDLEKIIHDKNRTITTLQSDITYLKSLTAESENKLLDVAKELEMSKENCEQLSSQLKKLVYQKNEEIAELKKQISKMSVTENRASQIIKVSAKYQAIILKRIAEIKSNTILKELTNFGNTANCDSDLKRNLNSGAITMEDLENFLETTDKHIKRCTEKQFALQKERDRLAEVNRINESEIINMKKFLTEVSVSIKTFNSIKDLYTQKLSRVVSMQRTVRREILNLDGQITDSTMCKLERGYAAVMQDLCECTMNLERWVERSIARTISAEKIKQAFTSEIERASLASTSFQNASLEVQLEELENSFQKLLEEVVRSQKGEGAKDAQAVTVMEVRAEYEDKLNRMKAKMKQLYQEQIQVFKNKQKEEIAALELELQKTRDKLAESSRAYEDHIKALTTELWSVGEKFLMKKDEAEWLRKKQKTGSLMSLQHLHSTGIATNHDELGSRPSDSQSLRSLPVRNGPTDRDKREGRGLHMSDEEGEVFDNRWLKELHTPRRESNAGQRLSELKWRNSLCPPHLKSSYPAETQFANTLDEEDIKSVGATTSLGGRYQRKEVGITAYKKPGPPTPSKQAGRLSATDSELRDSLRPEPEPAARKTSTPSRIRALFRSSRSDVVELPECPKREFEHTKRGTKLDIECIINESKYLTGENDCPNRESEFKSEIKYTNGEFEHPKSKTKYPNGESEHLDNETKYSTGESEHQQSETKYPIRKQDHPKSEIKYPKDELEHPKSETKYPKFILDNPKRETKYPEIEPEQFKSETKYPKLKLDHPKCETKYPNNLPEPLKSETKYPKLKLDHPKFETTHSKDEPENSKNETKYPKHKLYHQKHENDDPVRDSEHPKREIEQQIPETEHPKCENKSQKCDSEQTKCDSENPKRDWFKLNLRQRAALWEPLAKD